MVERTRVRFVEVGPDKKAATLMAIEPWPRFILPPTGSVVTFDESIKELAELVDAGVLGVKFEVIGYAMTFDGEPAVRDAAEAQFNQTVAVYLRRL